MDSSDTGGFVRVIDLETTGQGFADGGVVEVGWQDVAAGESGWALRGGPGALLVRPGHPITPATAAIHHIVDEDVADAPAWQSAAPPVLQAEPGPAPLALAAHRAAFEQRWCRPVQPAGARWVCTYKCALRIWPDAPTHSNQGLRYWRRPAGLDRGVGLPAHRAGPDAYVTAFHLRDMLAVVDLQQLLAWSDEPALLVKVPFGNWRGRRWTELTDDALADVAAGAGGNTDVAFTARKERERRGLSPGTPAPEPAQATML
jgi:exodeoxyribonuclease X